MHINIKHEGHKDVNAVISDALGMNKLDWKHEDSSLEGKVEDYRKLNEVKKQLHEYRIGYFDREDKGESFAFSGITAKKITGYWRVEIL